MDSRDTLKHYGVQGMKWGVRRYQPYQKGDGQKGKGKFIGKTKRVTRVKKPKVRNDVNAEKNKGLTDKQKKALRVTAGVAAMALVSIGAYHMHKNGKLDTLIDRGKKALSNEVLVDETTGFAKLKRGKVNLKKINDFDMFDRGTTMNCGNCTIATELQNRGLDVKAKNNPTGMTVNQMAQYFNLSPKDGVKTIPFDIDKVPEGKRMQEFAKEMGQTYPDGARGSVFVPHRFGSHFISFEISKGVAKFTDSQNIDADTKGLFEMVDIKNNSRGKKLGGIEVMRLDNAEINNKTIREVVASAKEGFIDMKATVEQTFDVRSIKGSNFVMPGYMDMLIEQNT